MSLLSEFAKDPESKYIVLDRKTKEIQTDCFVLKPILELEAYDALFDFAKRLDNTDPRKRTIYKWCEHIVEVWNERITQFPIEDKTK